MAMNGPFPLLGARYRCYGQNLELFGTPWLIRTDVRQVG